MAYASEDSFDSAVAEFLAGAVKDGAKAGVEAFVKETLTAAAQSILSAYAPGIADLLFGSDPLDAAVKTILEKIESLHLSIDEELAAIMNEIETQFSADLIASNRTASQRMLPFATNADLAYRIASKNRPCEAEAEFNLVRTRIEQYIESGSPSSGLQFRRLRLLPLHITAAQMAIVANGYCESIELIEAAYARSGQATLEGWLNTVTADEITRIASTSSGFSKQLQLEVLRFYTSLTEKSDVVDYVDDHLTPVISTNAVFQADPADYNSPRVITDPDSWGPEDDITTAPVLDGVRWFYHMDVPSAQCLSGQAHDALRSTRYIPWVEIEGRPAASDCNRFWVVSPHLVSTGWPNTHLASFDRYVLWFEDAQTVRRLHRQLIVGDHIRWLYAPIALILDEMHRQVYGPEAVRPRNQWDRVLFDWAENVCRLDLADSMNDGLTYGEVREAERLLRRRGANAHSAGLESWHQLLGEVLAADDPVVADRRIINGGFGSLYCVTDDGRLVWYQHRGAHDGSPDWVDQNWRVISTGRGWADYVQVVCAGFGVFYALTSDGRLAWYRHVGPNGAPDWISQNERIVSDGWGDRTILSAGGGVLYAVEPDGSLTWHRHNGWIQGTNSWTPAGPRTVSSGRGWGDFVHLTIGESTQFYGAKNDGSLVWYRHNDWASGEVDWVDESERIISTGNDWDQFVQILAAGAGVLYGVKHDGSLVWYQHSGYLDGSSAWADNRERVVSTGTGWNSFIGWRVFEGR